MTPEQRLLSQHGVALRQRLEGTLDSNLKSCGKKPFTPL